MQLQEWLLDSLRLLQPCALLCCRRARRYACAAECDALHWTCLPNILPRLCLNGDVVPTNQEGDGHCSPVCRSSRLCHWRCLLLPCCCVWPLVA